jgi:hypothetical protein
MAAAQIRMKALVASRLMMGDLPNWAAFEKERNTAGMIANRRTARSVSSQIGRGYRELSTETKNFIDRNFLHCGYDQLARLCDEVETGIGLSLRLDEFEQNYFPLAKAVKRQFPGYAHVHISMYGLQFEFPEHHFLRDIETSLPELLDTRSRLATFTGPELDVRRDRDVVGELVAKEKFLSRSTISATFSLAEAFLSGLFFTAVHSKSVGDLLCDEEFLKYAATKESAPLRDRLDRVVRFTSGGIESGDNEPFKTLIETGKRYRDAIHHTTPFQRKDVKPGGRLSALYEISADIALRCIVLSTATLLKISQWSNPDSKETDVAVRCEKILQQSLAGSPEFVVHSATAKT